MSGGSSQLTRRSDPTPHSSLPQLVLLPQEARSQPLLPPDHGVLCVDAGLFSLLLLALALASIDVESESWSSRAPSYPFAPLSQQEDRCCASKNGYFGTVGGRYFKKKCGEYPLFSPTRAVVSPPCPSIERLITLSSLPLISSSPPHPIISGCGYGACCDGATCGNGTYGGCGPCSKGSCGKVAAVPVPSQVPQEQGCGCGSQASFGFGGIC